MCSQPKGQLCENCRGSNWEDSKGTVYVNYTPLRARDVLNRLETKGWTVVSSCFGQHGESWKHYVWTLHKVEVEVIVNKELYTAVCAGDAPAVDTALTRGANPDHSVDGCSMLWSAVYEQCMTSVPPQQQQQQQQWTASWGQVLALT